MLQRKSKIRTQTGMTRHKWRSNKEAEELWHQIIVERALVRIEDYDNEPRWIIRD